MDRALREYPKAVLAVGNAPTALLRIVELLEAGARPALVIGVPVGFVNVVESKERLLEACLRYEVPTIVALGRKGGSSVAAAICNALLYTAAGQLYPGDRLELRFVLELENGETLETNAQSWFYDRESQKAVLIDNARDFFLVVGRVTVDDVVYHYVF